MAPEGQKNGRRTKKREGGGRDSNSAQATAQVPKFIIFAQSYGAQLQRGLHRIAQVLLSNSLADLEAPWYTSTRQRNGDIRIIETKMSMLLSREEYRDSSQSETGGNSSDVVCIGVGHI
ncbi:hypothetical protein PIIN_02356 [Serendipita indica DSM 11827]|uniref:Uncharacterized protein n=1 Tax=Serendipita indica (strain DSM 11827) TaxID=1109443 RepID=G4TAZ9_SERID|nr:hypothetical protein PIIN_02356 [Serendipita indica DSM 11827]